MTRNRRGLERCASRRQRVRLTSARRSFCRAYHQEIDRLLKAGVSKEEAQRRGRKAYKLAAEKYDVDRAEDAAEAAEAE